MSNVTPFSQRDPRWSNLKINNTSYTIGTDGCLICVLSSVAGITPDIAVVKLRFNGALVDWTSIGNIGLELAQRADVYDNDYVSQFITNNGSCIVRVDYDGYRETPSDTHFVLFIGNKREIDPWTGNEVATTKYPILTGYRAVRKVNMADTIAVERSKFEELVTKATKWDEIVKAGVAQASDVEELKRQIKEANSQASTAIQEARDTRSTLVDYQQKVAEKLNSPQDIARVLAAIQGLMDSEAQAIKNSEKDAFQLKVANEAIVELKARIAQLELELKANRSLATSTMLEMFREIIERFKRILNGI